MGPLTRTFVRRHRLDADVFRQAAENYTIYYDEAVLDYPGGCCHAIRRCVPNPARGRRYREFFYALLDDDSCNRLLYMWPVPLEVTGRNETTMLTPRLIALELCALMVEDLSGPAPRK